MSLLKTFIFDLIKKQKIKQAGAELCQAQDKFSEVVLNLIELMLNVDFIFLLGRLPFW